jgi:hypothetical protein
MTMIVTVHWNSADQNPMYGQAARASTFNGFHRWFEFSIGAVCDNIVSWSEMQCAAVNNTRLTAVTS